MMFGSTAMNPICGIIMGNEGVNQYDCIGKKQKKHFDQINHPSYFLQI